MNPSTLSLKELQIHLLACISRWTNYGVESGSAGAHLPHVVCLLQSIGYNLRRIDMSPPEDVTPLRDGSKGTRVVVTCGYSGQRCFLEYPETSEQCKCLNKQDNSHNSFWEVIGMDNSLIESGAAVIPAIPKDLNTFIKNILVMLIHFIEGTPMDNSKNSTGGSTSTATSSPNVRGLKLPSHLREMVSPAVIISSPNKVDPPRNVALVTPEKKDPVNQSILPCQSTPDMNSSGLKEDPDNIIKLLKQAISLLHTNTSLEMSTNQATFLVANRSKSECSLNSPQKTTEEFVTPKSRPSNRQALLTIGDKPKSMSSPNLSPMTPGKVETLEEASAAMVTDMAKSVSTPDFLPQKKALNPKPAENKKKTTSATANAARTPGVKTGIPKVTPKSANVASKASKKSDDLKTLCGKCATPLCGCLKTKKVYANVKSTIPKPSPLPRLVKKK